jgi:hypothetical protein
MTSSIGGSGPSNQPIQVDIAELLSKEEQEERAKELEKLEKILIDNQIKPNDTPVVVDNSKPPVDNSANVQQASVRSQFRGLRNSGTRI